VGIGVMIWQAAGSDLGQEHHSFGVAHGYFEAPWGRTYLEVLFVIPA